MTRFGRLFSTERLSRLNLIITLSVSLSCCGRQAPEVQRLPVSVEIRRVTSGPKHHFASAYYHIRTWDASERYLLCLETDIANRNPEFDEPATVGMVELETGRFIALARTRAWNFQQGAMQQWLGSSPDSLIVFNDYRQGRFVSVILNVHTGQEVKVIGRPVSAVSHDGRKAVSLNFARLQITRPGYGYPGDGEDARMDQKSPADDGLYFIDLETGEAELIVSLADLYEFNRPPPQEATGLLWMNHTLLNPEGTRVFFMGRTPRAGGRGWLTAAYTVNLDGSELRCVLPYDWSASHFDWLTEDRLMVTTYYQGRRPICHLLFTDTDGDKDFKVLGEGILTHDGHGVFSPDGRWMATDSYPDGFGKRTLLLLNMQNDAVFRLGRFNDPPDNYTGPARCDLHPAFNARSDRICFDSVDEGTRQVYLAELGFGN